MAICPFGVVLRRDSWQRANPHDFGRIAFASERVVLAAGYLPPRAPLGNSPTGNLRSNIVLLVHGLSLKKKPRCATGAPLFVRTTPLGNGIVIRYSIPYRFIRTRAMALAVRVEFLTPRGKSHSCAIDRRNFIVLGHRAESRPIRPYLIGPIARCQMPIMLFDHARI